MADSASDVEEHSKGGGALQTAKDLFAGAAGGVAQVLIGEFISPFSVGSWDGAFETAECSFENNT